MPPILGKIKTLIRAAQAAGRPIEAAELLAVQHGVEQALDRCAEVKTVRDEFAMAALRSDFVADCTSAETLAQRAYVVADAMLQERAKCK